MPAGSFNPVISEAFTVAPEVVYSPIVPLTEFETKRFDPDTAMLNVSFNPVISEAFTVVPEVVYSPISSEPGSEQQPVFPTKRTSLRPTAGMAKIAKQIVATMHRREGRPCASVSRS